MSYLPIVGTGPFGAGTPLPPGPPPPPVLGSSRQLGTGTENRGQYVLSGGNPVFDTDVRQLAIIALTTVLDSSCVLGLGRGPEPPTIDDNFYEQKRAQIDAALAALVKAKLLAIERLTIDEVLATGRTVTKLTLRDISDNQPFEVNLS